jgi:hypothetical protein
MDFEIPRINVHRFTPGDNVGLKEFFNIRDEEKENRRQQTNDQLWFELLDKQVEREQ